MTGLCSVKHALIAAAIGLALTGAAEAACRVVKAETDVDGVRLGDAASARRVLGEIARLPFEAEQAAAGASDAGALLTVFNRDKSEMAVFERPGGAAPGAFSNVLVRAGEPTPGKSMIVNTRHFATAHGVKLGVSQAFVTGLLGPCFTRRYAPRPDATLQYDVGDPERAFPEEANLPRYIARYRFKNGRLASFTIGYQGE